MNPIKVIENVFLHIASKMVVNAVSINQPKCFCLTRLNFMKKIIEKSQV